MPRCPECDTDYPDQLDACPACAADQEVVRCGACGERFQGSDACPACGELRSPVGCEAHGDQEAVGRCVVCGRAVCAACREPGRRAVLCADHGDVNVIEGWAQVYTTTGEFDAQLVRENLRAEGIDAQVFSQRDRAFSVEVGDLSIVRLLVPVWEYEPARRLIREHMDGAGEVGFACHECGEAYDAGTEACPACGASLA